MPAVSLRAALLCLMLPHLWCGIVSLDAAQPVDPYAFNYDHNSQTNKFSDEEIQKMVESECSKLVEDACIKCSEETRRNCGNETWEISPSVLPQLREKDDKICDSVVFLHLIKGIAEAFTKEQTEQVVMTLDSYRIEKLHKFLRDDSGDIPSVDIVYMLTSSLSPLSNTAHAPYSTSWFEQTFSISFIKAAICLVVLVLFAILLKLLLTGNISYIRLICALVVAVLIINFAWSYMLLYKKKISERMANDAQRKEFEEVCHSEIHLTASQKMKAFLGLHLPKDERCQKFIESYQIDPFLEVHPIEAITDTFERIITSLSGAFGKSLGNFNNDFFSNVSVVYWIPAMVFNLLLIAVILAVYLYCGRRRIIVQEVRDNQAFEGYGRDHDRIEEAYHAGIEPRREPAPQHPALRQQGEVRQGDQSVKLVENSGVCSAAAGGGGSHREDGREIRRRKINDSQREEHIVASDRAGEGDCVVRQKDGQRTIKILEERADEKLDPRVQDIGTVESERKLGTTTGHSEDVNSKLQPKNANVSGVPVSNNRNCEGAEGVIISQKEELESHETKENDSGMDEHVGEAELIEQLVDDDDDFIVLPES